MADSDRKRSSISPSPRQGRSRSVSRSRSPQRLGPIFQSPQRRRPVSQSPQRRRPVSRSPERRRPVSRSPERLRSVSRSPERLRSVSRSPERLRSVTRSPQRRRSSRSRSRSYGRDETNPGNTLFVTGLSSRVTDRDLEDHFSKEGKVSSVFLVVEPRTRISRGFAFVNMDTLEDAERCIKYLNQSVLEGRYITVEKSRRKRPRTPTPGHYLGLSKRDGFRGDRGGGHDRYRGGGGGGGGGGRDDYDYRRSPRQSPSYRGSRGYSPHHSPYGYNRSRRERSRSHSPYDTGYGRRSGAYGR